MGRSEGFHSLLFFAAVLLTAAVAATEPGVPLARREISVDGRASDWAGVPSHPLANDGILRVALGPRDLFILVHIPDPTAALLVRCKGLTLWIDGAGGRSTDFGIRYAGSKALAEEIDRVHDPFRSASLPKEGEATETTGFPSRECGLSDGSPSFGPDGAASTPRAPSPHEPPPGCMGPSPGTPGGRPPLASPPEGVLGERVRRTFERAVEPGLLFVRKGKRDVIQFECSGASDPCAASRYDSGVFCYEFSVPLSALCPALPSPGSGNGRALSIGLELPELALERETTVELSPPDGTAGGVGGRGDLSGSRGPGGGSPPVAAGGRQGPGGRGGRSRPKGPAPGPPPVYTVTTRTVWLDTAWEPRAGALQPNLNPRP